MAETADKQDAKKAADAEAKAAEERAKQNDADIETFLSFHRGEALVRVNGHVDLAAFIAAREADKKEAEKSDKDKD
jgi:hypothetical protein